MYKRQGDIQWAKASLDTVRGRIESEWHRDGAQLTLRVTIPANTSATLHLPTADASTVSESGQAIAQSTGVRFLKSDKSVAYFSLKSGTYNFSFAYLAN